MTHRRRGSASKKRRAKAGALARAAGVVDFTENPLDFGLCGTTNRVCAFEWALSAKQLATLQPLPPSGWTWGQILHHVLRLLGKPIAVTRLLKPT